MRKTPWLLAEPHRVTHGPLGSSYGADYGCFLIPGPMGVELKVIVSAAEAQEPVVDQHLEPWTWDHVSVSTRNRCPNWPEMDFIKDIFFAEDECAMQLHVPKADHIDCHPYCLHIWKPAHVAIPRPPALMVGPVPVKEAVS